MAYPPDAKLHLDEEAHDGSRAVGWQPITQEKMENMREQDFNMKMHVRLLRLIVRMFAFALSCFMLYSQVYMLNKYLSTRGIVRDGRNAWATTTTLWPTILLLTTSAITVLVTTFMLVSYAWGVKKANWTAMRIYVPWVILELAVHLAIWIATTIGYRVGKTGSDLWGWSCSSKAANIQKNFLEVDFNFSCSLQSDAWATSIAQVVLMVLSSAAWLLAWRRNSHQKKLRNRESLLTNSEFQQHGSMPPAYNPNMKGPTAYGSSAYSSPAYSSPDWQQQQHH